MDGLMFFALRGQSRTDSAVSWRDTVIRINAAKAFLLPCFSFVRLTLIEMKEEGLRSQTVISKRIAR